MNEKIMLNPAYMLSKVGDDYVLLPCDDAGGVDLTEIIVLNETAYDIISYIEKKPASFVEILEYLSDIYETSDETLNSDIELFISELDKRKVLIRKNSSL